MDGAAGIHPPTAPLVADYSTRWLTGSLQSE